MATKTAMTSLVQQYASMTPREFGPSIEPKWKVGERIVGEVRSAVEKQQRMKTYAIIRRSGWRSPKELRPDLEPPRVGHRP